MLDGSLDGEPDGLHDGSLDGKLEGALDGESDDFDGIEFFLSERFFEDLLFFVDLVEGFELPFLFCFLLLRLLLLFPFLRTRVRTGLNTSSGSIARAISTTSFVPLTPPSAWRL